MSALPIYLDNNATTPLLPAVWDAMRPFAVEQCGNPASAHHAGRRARRALEDARERLAALLDAEPDEVVFTSGATEANNLAIVSSTGAIATSYLEHPSVIEPVRHLAEKGGCAVTWLPVDEHGCVCLDSLTPDTRLLCVQLANHETGHVQPIRRLRNSSAFAPLFHCDAVQAVGRMPVRFHELGVSTLSLSAHKFHGPAGIGTLLVRRGTRLRPLFHGGHQQHERRPGTEPVALAVGLVTALELALRDMDERRQHVERLRDAFLNGLRTLAEPVLLNGPTNGDFPHTLNLSFPGCRSDSLLMNLDLAGIACSIGSACSSGSLLPSPVLQALGLAAERLTSSLRFSLNHLLTKADMEEAARRVTEVVARLRRGFDPT